MTGSPPHPPEAIDPDQIASTLVAIRNRPPPSDPSGAGCAAAIVAIVALVFMPVLARLTPLTSDFLFGLGIGLGVIALAGGVAGFFGGGLVRGKIVGDVEDAIEQLLDVYPHGDPAAMRQAAVRILDQSVVHHGPTAVSAFDREEVAARLGDALAYVVRVERILLERDQIYPCFTMDGLESGGSEPAGE